jgi:endonuclease/exonuclease/phosphatase family metal-dependent hydrolase
MSQQKDWMKTFLQLPLPFKVVGLALVGVVLLIVLLTAASNHPDEGDKKGDNGTVPAASEEGYLFCFWNVENLFDDVDDQRREVDEKYDNAFARDEKLRNTKLGNLSKVLLAMNGGKGPDILAMAELESDRAAELLQERLNKDLPSGAAEYKHRLFKEQKSGRHIAPAILTRLPVVGDRTQHIGAAHQRILEGHIKVNDHQLVVIASHWTSRLARRGSRGGDESKNEEQRCKYGNSIYGRFKAMYLSNPAVDLLVCGDFNDDPEDKSVVEHLRGTGDRNALTRDGDPMLFNLAAGRDKDVFGTLSHHNKWNLFDQILVSPGMLDDKGWTCLPETFRTERQKSRNRRGHPWSFDEDYEGHRHRDKKFSGERGYSDHFPVTVRLKVKD